ncbi:MAG: hypothetical protein ABIA12_02090 [Candidatus Aenigmatarchaeota archaeon]
MPRKYTEEEVADAMAGRRLIVLDFEDSIVTRKRYVWEGFKLLKSHPEKASRFKDAYKLAKNRNNVSEEGNRAFDIFKVVKGLPYEISHYFGTKLAKHNRTAIIELMLFYDGYDNAIVTRDDIGTVLPTIEEMADSGITIGKYIASKAGVTEDGMISGEPAGSVSYGIDGWDDGWYMITPEDKVRGIKYICRSYGLGLESVVYITDDDPGEARALEYVIGGGGTVLKAKRLSRLKRRPPAWPAEKQINKETSIM